MTDETPSGTAPVMRKGHSIPDWTPTADGKLVEKVYNCESGDEASKMAKRLITLSYRSGQILELRIDAQNLTIRLPAVDGKVRNEVFKLIRKLPGTAPVAGPDGKHAFSGGGESAGKPAPKKAMFDDDDDED